MNVVGAVETSLRSALLRTKVQNRVLSGLKWGLLIFKIKTHLYVANLKDYKFDSFVEIH